MTPSTTIDLLYLDAGGGPIRLHALDVRLHLRWPGPNEMPCNAALVRGQELGWFEHGSTILVFAPPASRWRPVRGCAWGRRCCGGTWAGLESGSTGPTCWTWTHPAPMSSAPIAAPPTASRPSG